MSLFKRIKTNERGVAAIEFALIFPLMLVVYAGMVDVTQAYMAKRKLAMAVGYAGDILARYSSVDADNLNTIIDAARSTIAPMNVDKFKITLSLLNVTGSSTNVVCSYGDQPLTVGANQAVPSGLTTLAQNGLLQDLVYVSGSFESYSILSHLVAFQPSFNFTEKAHFRPRINDTISFPNCNSTTQSSTQTSTTTTSGSSTTTNSSSNTTTTNNSSPCVSNTSSVDLGGTSSNSCTPTTGTGETATSTQQTNQGGTSPNTGTGTNTETSTSQGGTSGGTSGTGGTSGSGTTTR